MITVYGYSTSYMASSQSDLRSHGQGRACTSFALRLHPSPGVMSKAKMATNNMKKKMLPYPEAESGSNKDVCKEQWNEP